MVERWQTDSSLNTKLTARVADLEQRFTQTSVLPLLLARDPRLTEALRDQTGIDKLNHLLALTVKESEVSVAFVMNTAGTTIASSNFDTNVSFIGKNYAFRPYFANAMKGMRSTYFAVGATTGIPGYFISEPVRINDTVGGVVVIKLEPRELPFSWADEQTVTVLTDELGVPILSTNAEFLYRTTRKLNDTEFSQISEERRYPVSTDTGLQVVNSRLWTLESAEWPGRYRATSVLLSIEPWTLTVLTPFRSMVNRAVRNIAAVLGLITIAWLLYYAYRQQKVLAIERGRTAAKLEQLVEEKTRDLKQAQNALIAESNFSMLGKMSAAINHEINQPLASMRFDLATLRQILTNTNTPVATSSAEDSDAQSVVVNLDRTAKRIARVIETLRVLPKQQKSTFTPVDIHSVIEQSVDTVITDRKQLSQHLNLNLGDLERGSHVVHGNSVLLRQALLNLLYNALDALVHTDGEQYADILASIEGDNIKIDVRDSGNGIDPLVKAVLFEPFESSSGKAEGLGLGLTLARQIASLHGGDVSCDRVDGSDVLLQQGGELTVFSLTLPLASMPQAKYDEAV